MSAVDTIQPTALPSVPDPGADDSRQVLAYVRGLRPGLRTRRGLVLGCGSGAAVRALGEELAECHGVDRSAARIRQAEEHNPEPARLVFHVDQAGDLRMFEDEQFDFVLVESFLSTLDAHYSKHYLAECLRVLAPGGAMVFRLAADPVASIPGSSAQTVGKAPLAESAFRAQIFPVDPPKRVAAGSKALVWARVKNLSDVTWPALGARDGSYRILLGNHWRVEDGTMLVNDDARAPLPADLHPGAEGLIPLFVTVPETPGRYVLELDMIQQSITWFRARGSETGRCVLDAVAAADDDPDLAPVYPIKPHVVRELLERDGAELLAEEPLPPVGAGWPTVLYVAARLDPATLPAPEDTSTREAIRTWIESPDQWPTDSYDLATLAPAPVLARREADLRPLVPEWFWAGVADEAALSIGAGKLYFERKYWTDFKGVYVLDPSEQTRLALEHFPIPNAAYLGRSLFAAPHRLETQPAYGWLGACIHYLFEEFHGWEFMQKLAMMVGDTLVVDAGAFDAATPHGEHMRQRWGVSEPFERYRLAQFSFDQFRRAIQGYWSIELDEPTPWIEGRRNLVLRRTLPPRIEKADLGPLEPVVRRDYLSVFRTREGYYKESGDPGALLMYDVVSKAMGWPEMVRWAVHEGDRFAGFVVQDYGDELPADASVSEQLFLKLCAWSLPLGLIPLDVARENVRLYQGKPVWIDVDLARLGDLDARKALWMTANMYKQYEQRPAYINQGMYEA